MKLKIIHKLANQLPETFFVFGFGGRPSPSLQAFYILEHLKDH